MIIDDEVKAVVLAVVVVVGVFASSQALFGSRVVEPFSELAVLGPNMKIGDYLGEVVVGEPLKLYLYVGNHEGRTMYYSVLVKLGDRSTPVNETRPMQVSVVARFDRVLMNGENWTRPVTVSIGKSGVGIRLVFELWVYDEAVDGLRYHGRWNQIWMNVTKPVLL